MTSTHLAMPNMCAYVLQKKTHAHNTIFECVYTHFDDDNDDGDGDGYVKRQDVIFFLVKRHFLMAFGFEIPQHTVHLP